MCYLGGLASDSHFALSLLGDYELVFLHKKEIGNSTA